MQTDAQALWSQLVAGGLAAGDAPAAGEMHTPWYVRVMLGIAGIIAAFFLFGFVGVAFVFVLQSQSASIAVGLMVIAAAYLIFRAAPRNDFTVMFALAVSIAGQGLVIAGLRPSTQISSWAAFALLEATLAILMPNAIHRFLSSYAAAIAFGFVCALSHAYALAGGAAAVPVAWIWFNEAQLSQRHSLVASIGYGLTLALIHLEATSRYGGVLPWSAESGRAAVMGNWTAPGEALVVVTLIAAVAALLRRNGAMPQAPKMLLGLLAATMVGAASFKAPGIAAGLMIALLGFSNGNRVLTGVGISALLFYVSSYYYFLDATLLTKSGVLLAVSLALLLARWLVLNVLMPDEEHRNA